MRITSIVAVAVLIASLSVCYGTEAEIKELLRDCSRTDVDSIALSLLRNPGIVMEANRLHAPLVATAAAANARALTETTVAYLLAKNASATLPDENGASPLEIAIDARAPRLV